MTQEVLNVLEAALLRATVTGAEAPKAPEVSRLVRILADSRRQRRQKAGTR